MNKCISNNGISIFKNASLSINQYVYVKKTIKKLIDISKIVDITEYAFIFLGVTAEHWGTHHTFTEATNMFMYDLINIMKELMREGYGAGEFKQNNLTHIVMGKKQRHVNKFIKHMKVDNA